MESLQAQLNPHTVGISLLPHASLSGDGIVAVLSKTPRCQPLSGGWWN